MLMARIVLISDRSPDEVLPAIRGIDADLKVEPLAVDSLVQLPDLSPDTLIVDAEENAPHAFRLLTTLAATDLIVPVIAVVARADLEAYAWAQVADEFLYAGAPETEIRTRLAMLRRRIGGGPDATVRLGPLAVNTDTYQVTVSGRPLDLTYKEFELLRYLAERPGRVFSRAALLQEVWGYDFYGGTRTVDVHVRRLRAKLGAEHEHLIETVRGVGYRAAAVRTAHE
jgi:DNA-binding response OmpR family regulator